MRNKNLAHAIITRLIIACLAMLCCIGTSAQKFYYDGGYFEKMGNQWYEYKPEQKAGVWNRFTQTDSTDNDYYIIDNGACKVAVPKTIGKDFLILLKGHDDWQFKYKSVAAPVESTPKVKAGQASAPGQYVPRDRRAFHRAYFNEGGVCILGAYCLLLDYANSTANTIPDFDSYDVMAEYMRYQNTLEPTGQLSAQYIRDNHREGERTVSKAINGYCMARGWSGLLQVNNFHKWLATQQPWAEHIDIV